MTETIVQTRGTSGLALRVRSAALALMFGLGLASSLGAAAQAAQEVNVNGGYAVHGYDVVAYFTAGQPTEGDDRYTAEFEDVTYRFASADNRDRFTADPAAFTPEFGGFCAFGASVGRKFDGDPNAWRIVDGKLYLNLNKKIQSRWLQDTAGYIRGANHNWAVIASLPDSELESNPPEGLTQGAI
jgi:YHS domain-containing protein